MVFNYKLDQIDAPSGREWTSAQLARSVLALAKSLREVVGIRPGDVVSIR